MVAVFGGASYLQSKDIGLSKARELVAATPEIAGIVGTPPSFSVVKSISFSGVPGKEPAYNQYTMFVTGPKGSVTVLVRAYPGSTKPEWTAEVLKVN